MSTQAEDDVISQASSFDRGPVSPAPAAPEADSAVAGRTRQFDTPRLRKDFADHPILHRLHA